jgi:hypothetical protein
MRSVAYIALLFVVILIWGCEKDPVIPAETFMQSNLQSFLATRDTQSIQAPALAFTSDFATNETRIDLLFHSKHQVNELSIFRTDTLANRDSVVLYKQEPLYAWEERNNIYRLELPIKAHDHYLRFFYTTDSGPYLSDPIGIRQSSLSTDTLSANAIDVVAANDGYLDFQWPSVPATDLYFIQLFNEQGDAFVQLTLDRTQFSFFDLRRILHNFTPSLRDPELIEGTRYEVQVDAIGRQGWHLAQGSKAFIAP